MKEKNVLVAYCGCKYLVGRKLDGYRVVLVRNETPVKVSATMIYNNKKKVFHWELHNVAGQLYMIVMRTGEPDECYPLAMDDL